MVTEDKYNGNSTPCHTINGVSRNAGLLDVNGLNVYSKQTP